MTQDDKGDQADPKFFTPELKIADREFSDTEHSNDSKDTMNYNRLGVSNNTNNSAGNHTNNNISSNSNSVRSNNNNNISSNSNSVRSTNNVVLPSNGEGMSPGSADGSAITQTTSLPHSIRPKEGSSKMHSSRGKNIRRTSASSLSTNNISYLKPSVNTPGNRTSTLSNYSGIVHNLDFDTIKYVGNKASLQLSDLGGITSSDDEELLVMHSPAGSFKSQSSFKDLQSKSSLRNSSVLNLNNENMVKLIRNKVDNSPTRQGISPPKSPLPKLEDMSLAVKSPPPSPTRSPLKNSLRRTSAVSSSSSSSSRLHGKLDDLMKDVEDLNLYLEDGGNHDDDNEKSGLLSKPTMSLTSTNSLNTGANSFYTANSEDGRLDPGEPAQEFQQLEDGDPVQESSSESTESLHVASNTLDPSKRKDDQETLKASPPTILRSRSDTSKTKKTSNSSNRHSKDSTGSGGSTRHKSKKKRNSKHKIKPFSYETLAKLLNATDGIIIGQEFATLDIPTQEKLLIERIVDSISRLTANMILNPARYDQSCARLERVLNVLEGFD